MKLRGPYAVSRSKTIPFLLTAVFLLLLGLALVLVGLLIEFDWKYDMAVFYKPWWTGGLVTIAGLFVSMFCCMRTPAVAVIVTTVCLPALACSILQLTLSGLMADALTPDDKKFFCSSKLVGNSTLYCKCEQDISFNVTLKGTMANTTTSAFCEDEMEFLFELMLAVACMCGLLILLLFPYVIWAYCTVTRPTYEEKKNSMLFNGTLTKSGTLKKLQGTGTTNGPLVLANTMTRSQTLNGPLVINNTMTRSQRPPSRALSVQSGGFRPIVTVQRAQTMGTFQTPVTSTMRSQSGTLKGSRAPRPPRQERYEEPIYNNVERDPIRAAEQHRFDIPSDIQGIRPSNNHRQSLSATPIHVTKLPRKPTRNSLAEDDGMEDSSEDNTTDVVHNFKSSPKQLNATPDGKIQNYNSNLDTPESSRTRG
jgi:hypothetical protein